MNSVVLWMAVALAAPGTGAPAGAPLPGQYVTIGSSPLRCELEITVAARYILSCHGRRRLEGSVVQAGMAILLSGRWRSRRLEEDRDYAAAADVHINEQLEEHRFYPVVVAPPEDDRRSGLPCGLVAVSFAEHLFLVDTFDRDEFCADVAGGRHSPMVKGRHLTFRSRGRKDGGVPAREFCREGWQLRLRD